MQSYREYASIIHLSGEHEHMLLQESGIDIGVAAERGYTTVRSRADLLDFRKYQRRAPALRVPIYSLDGETTSSQIRPDNPRVRNGKAVKYETAGGSRCILDVHPRMRDEVRVGNDDLWITEGIKKADSLTSRGLPTIGLIGVWNWQRGGKMLPCWEHILLKGRRVYVVYDSDVRTKDGVQMALERLVAALEARGAEVMVVYLPESEKGVDDYLVAGGTVAELKMLARKFEPQDLGRIRLSRDEKLRAAVEDLERRWCDEEWKGRGGHSDRDIALKLIEAAARCGEFHADGLRVRVSWGTLQVGAKVARRTLAKGLARLEQRGFLYRDNEGRKADKTGAFVLRAKVDQYGSKKQREGKVPQRLRVRDRGGLPLRVPRFWWSRPKWKPSRKMRRKYRMGEISWIPEPRERIMRLGKIRGAVVDVLEIAGGSCTLSDLCEVLGYKRERDVKRRILPMLEARGIIEWSGSNEVISLAADWSDRLHEARADGGEIEADELAEDRRKRKSRAYRERDKAPVSKPSQAGLAAVNRSQEKRAENNDKALAEREAAVAADLEHRRFVKRFVYDRLRTLGRVRLALLQEVLKDAGGTPGYALPAAKSLRCTLERLPEYNNAEFVCAPREWVA